MSLGKKAILQCLISIAFILAGARVGAEEFSDRGLEILPFVHIKSHGYFRFRSDLFYRLDLANDTSGFRKPLSQNAANQPLNRATSSITSSNMRLRYSPLLLVGERLKIHSTIDFLDNFVFGSSPSFNYENPYEPLPFMSESATSRISGSFKDVVRVKSVYLEWQLFNQIYLFAGRMPEHFGLGILKNSGECLECNFGNFTDTAGFTVKLTDFYFSTHLDFPGEGVTSDTGIYSAGQPHDAESYDDITRWTFKLFFKPLTLEEERERLERLSKWKVAIDWGILNTITFQNLTSETAPQYQKPECMNVKGQYPIGLDYDCVSLAKRDAFFWNPDLWVRLELNRAGIKLRLEAELAAVYGSITRTQSYLLADTPHDFLGFGGAFEGELDLGKDWFGLMAGFATGDEGGCFGIYDCQKVVAPTDYEYGKDPSFAANKEVTGFIFSRDYYVDLILFKEVIGAVSNATYVKPWYRRVLLERKGHSLSVEGGLLYAWANEKSITPGNSAPLGVETDLKIQYNYGERLTAQILAGFLYPLGAFKNQTTGESPEPASTIQGRLFITF